MNPDQGLVPDLRDGQGRITGVVCLIDVKAGRRMSDVPVPAEIRPVYAIHVHAEPIYGVQLLTNAMAIVIGKFGPREWTRPVGIRQRYSGWLPIHPASGGHGQGGD